MGIYAQFILVWQGFGVRQPQTKFLVAVNRHKVSSQDAFNPRKWCAGRTCPARCPSGQVCVDCTCAASGSGKLILSLCKRYADVEFVMFAVQMLKGEALSKGAVHF
jgi:hypothetical protein